MRFCVLLPLISCTLLAACDGSDAPGDAAPPAGPTVIELSGSVGRAGDTLYLPFEMPPGVQRLDAAFGEGSPDTKIGIGVFDGEGADFAGPGFRGIAGEERREFFVAGGEATPGFVAGPLGPGPWTLVVPNFLSRGTANVKLTLSYAAGGRAPAREAVPETVTDRPGWYFGDLHVHTVHSSDAWSSGAALDPAQMAQRAQARGLHFISLTDHNVTTQNDRLRSASPPGFLLLGGEEVTTWKAGPGHMTASGLQSADWIDWRFRPRLGVYADTAAWGPYDRPVQSVLALTRAMGVYTSAAHPKIWPGFGSDWGFFADSDLDPSALPDGLEVWNGSASFTLSWGPEALKQWDRELGRLRHVCGNGGSDVHGVGGDTEVGKPATVVFASALSRAAVIEALHACRGYMTTDAQGPALMLSGEGPGGQRQLVGGTLYGGPGDTVTVRARITGGDGGTLVWIRNGASAGSERIDGADRTVTRSFAIGDGGAVRAELRASALSSDPLALSNPLFLRIGAASAGGDDSAAIAEADALLPGAAAP